MSLHTLANHLQSAGRGEDKVLVHMTPGEVNGLQSLAMAHGGSLTINPQTGLPEAGFLSSLLPMVAGGALTVMSGGALSPLTAAMITGAGYTAATGSLRKGIMAGLGAYGGAGMASGLSAMGTTAPTTSLAQAPTVAPEIAGAANTVPAATTADAPTQIFSGNVSTVPEALKGSGLGGYGAQPGIFTPGAQGGTAIPAPAPGPEVVSHMPSEIISEFPQQFKTNLPLANPSLDHQFYQRYGTVPDVAYERMVPSTGGGYQPVGTKVDLTGMAKAHVASRPTLSPIDPANPYANAMDAGSYSFQEAAPQSMMDKLGTGFRKATTNGLQGIKDFYAASEAAAPYSGIASLGATAANYYDEKRKEAEEEMRRRANQSPGLIRPYDFEYNPTGVASQPYSGSGERIYFNPTFTARTPYEAPGPEYAAKGGLMGYAVGGPIEQMSAMNAVGSNTDYPMANINTPIYANPAIQRPEAVNVIAPSADAGVGAYSGEARFAEGGSSSGYKYSYDPESMRFTQTAGPSDKTEGMKGFLNRFANKLHYGKTNQTPAATVTGGTVTGGVAQPIVQPTSQAQPLTPNINIPAYQTPEQQLGLGGFYNYMNQQLAGYGGYAAGGNVGGGISHLGDYSDGGRLLKGPGDGVSDSIPASIGDRQPARLADGEFVVPARIVSEIGNGSTEAGARKLYEMMDRVQKARSKTTGKGKVAVNTKAEKLLPA